ncbi:Gfo/Idh/MocA family protein [Massiliimalia massiliensis]|jgi:predicted dehydrogenase|uniref:Gfo/Idh/MocA family protein n=1 Tax=Massiliimalia massiliensis TaxID=1852384 RepID=UPI000985ACDE|nr:Gfo/Idh/MocA family oxidoreductase [Massiliimalia massiliensis]
MKKLRLGIIGTGIIARAHMAGILEARQSELAAVCDIKPEQAERFLNHFGLNGVKVYQNYEDMLTPGTVDAVIVSTPTVSHAEIAIQAAKAGIHVLCEKTMAMNAAEARKMADQVKGKKLVHTIGFAFRYIPAVEYIKDLIEAGKFGKIRHFRGRFYANRLAPADHVMEWRHRMREAGSGVIGDLASHTFDMFHYLARGQMGDIVKLAAHGDIIIPERVNENGEREKVTTDETLLVWMKTANQGEVTLESSRYSPFEFEFHITGSKASLKYCNYKYDTVEYLEYEREGLYAQNNAQEYSPIPVPERYYPNHIKDRFIRQYLAFEQAILGQGTVKTDFETGYDNQVFMDLIQKSYQEEKTISI